MAKSDKAAGGTANYTAEQEAILVAASPVKFEDVAELADELGKSPRSVIAKCKSLGVEYIPKPAPRKKPKGMTKATVADTIRNRLDRPMLGLENAPLRALTELLNGIQHIEAAKSSD